MSPEEILKKNIKITPKEAAAHLCRTSFFEFVKAFWRVVIPDEPVFNWHIKYLCDELQYLNSFVKERKPKPYDLIINVPPGSTKSTIATQMYNAWVWTTDPAQRFVTSSYSQKLSLAHSTQTRNIVTSDMYLDLFPEVILKEDEKSKSDFKTTRGGQRFTTSTTGSVTGMHGHQIVIDDPLSAGQSESEKEREAAWEGVKTLATRKVDKAITPLIIIMQRLHENDPTGMMLATGKSNIKHICLPAELPSIEDNNVYPMELRDKYVKGLMDPVRMNLTVLTEAKSDLGSYGYAGQYAQNAAPAEGGMYKKNWFEIIPWDPSYRSLRWNFVIDPAFTKNEKNDPSGMWSYAMHENDYIVRQAETVYKEFPELCKHVKSWTARHGYNKKSIIEVEPKASGKSLVQTLKRTTKLKIKEGKPPSKDKVARAKDSSPTAEAGRIKFIEGPWNKEAIDQICTFPNAAHDEHMDCLTMMVGDDNPKKRKLKRRN